MCPSGLQEEPMFFYTLAICTLFPLSSLFQNKQQLGSGELWHQLGSAQSSYHCYPQKIYHALPTAGVLNDGTHISFILIFSPSCISCPYLFQRGCLQCSFFWQPLCIFWKLLDSFCLPVSLKMIFAFGWFLGRGWEILTHPVMF